MHLTQLKQELAKMELPKEVQLTKWERIVDVPLFVASHIATLEAHPKNRTFMPYYRRLLALYKILCNDRAADTI